MDKVWPNNYGVWMDEADHFGYSDCIDRVWKQAGIVFDEETPELILERPYGRVDRKSLKARLLQECQDGSRDTDDLEFEALNAKATKVEHFDNRPSQVTILQQSKDQKAPSTFTVDAMLVVDATGFSRQFTKHDTVFDPGFQVTYGAKFRVPEASNPYSDSLNKMILMDYSEKHLWDDAELRANNDRFPTFCYIMPLAKDEVFLEETVLVSRPGASSKDLEKRLFKRMKALGFDNDNVEILEDERAAIPMGGTDPQVPQRTLGFGATASLVHPASGYMVARAMEIAPRVADSLAPQLKKIREGDTSAEVIGAKLDEMTTEGWKAVWPVDDQRQRDFMHFGFELLCLLNPQELRDFFTGFFKLPDALWEHFLSWRLSGIGHTVMGLRVWAQCIPRRFMIPMVIKSIPFLPNRLIGPSVSRGNFEAFDTRSVYADARTGNFTLWEPEQFYPYLDKLRSTGMPNEEVNGKSKDQEQVVAEPEVAAVSEQ
jgi:lycopene cyclase-like protein